MGLTISGGMTITGGLTVSTPGGGGGGAYATGGTIYDITGYKVHIFNASDTFATTSSWPSGRTIEYLVVGGGGAAGAGESGGGAGGYLTVSGVAAAGSTNYAVTIGAGGASLGSNGGNSSVIGGAISVTSIGGGAGGDVAADGQNGGSGGGGGTDEGGGNGVGGKGVYPGSTYLSQARQGYDGSDATGKYGSYSAGGGGGAGGFTANTRTQAGGDGLTNSMLTTTSTSSLSITTGYQAAGDGTTNFTVASGLWYQANQAIYIYRTSDPTKYMWGIVTAYSGTTLTCRLVAYFTGSFSDWTIQYAMSGGGGYNAQGGWNEPSLGGGAGRYGSSGTISVAASPNSGGGGSVSSTAGGSGVVLIKYAYP
jgi:hypothetical protein